MVVKPTKEKGEIMALRDNWQGRERLQGVMYRADVRDRIQDAAQIFFDRTGKGVNGKVRIEGLPPGVGPGGKITPKTDYTPAYIAAGAAIIAAIIVTRRK